MLPDFELGGVKPSGSRFALLVIARTSSCSCLVCFWRSCIHWVSSIGFIWRRSRCPFFRCIITIKRVNSVKILWFLDVNVVPILSRQALVGWLFAKMVLQLLKRCFVFDQGLHRRKLLGLAPYPFDVA